MRASTNPVHSLSFRLASLRSELTFLVGEEGDVKHIIACFLLKINLSVSLSPFLDILFFRFHRHHAYLRQPAVLVKAVSHSRWRGLQLSSPPLRPRSQPEWGTITSSASACRAWSTISIFTASWDERFHKVAGMIQ